MRAASVAAAVFALAQWARGADQQPLSHHHQPPTPKDRDELVRLHRSLVSIESITGNEERVGRFLVDHLAGKGYTVETQLVAPGHEAPSPANSQRFNVLAWRGGKEARPRVVVTSHIDVVPPYIPYGIDGGGGRLTRDTVIRGRGSVDAKGSVAAMIVAVDGLLAAGRVRGGDVMLVFVVGEEVAGDGMRAFSDSLHAARRFDAVIFGEPTENRLACGHKGALFCDVAARGVGGHSGYPWLGKSANALMVRAMAALLDADLGSSELFGNTTVNIGRFDGGVAANVIAEHAAVMLAARVAVGADQGGAEAVRRGIQAILDAVDGEAFSLDCYLAYGPVECNCDVPGFETIVVNYGTDIANLKGDHARYLYGPGTILAAHGPRENLTVGDLETAVDGYQRLILHALGQ